MTGAPESVATEVPPPIADLTPVVAPPVARSARWWWSAGEVVLLVGLMLAADAIWGAGDRFARVEPHPFWAIVLVMAVQYGTREALTATFVCSVALLAGNLPEPSLDVNVHDYTLRVLGTPLLWMAAAVILGELRTRHRQQQEEAREELRKAARRVSLLSRAHGELTAAKERLETRLAGQIGTATGLFAAARRLETHDPAAVLAGASELVSLALHARSFSIYRLDGDALVLAAGRGWSDQRRVAERYPAATPLFRAVVAAQHFVSVATPDGEAVLNGEGLIAGPLVDPDSGRLVGMLKIEEMTFLDFNLSTVQTFKVLCEWMASAYVQALVHQANQIQDEATHLYAMKYLDRQTAYVTELALRFGFDLSLLLFRVEVDELTEAERAGIPAALGEIAPQVLRRTDLVFSHEPPGTRFAVLLPGAPPENVAIVAGKLRDRLVERCGHPVTCSTEVRVLCRAKDSASRDRLRTAADIENWVA